MGLNFILLVGISYMDCKVKPLMHHGSPFVKRKYFGYFTMGTFLHLGSIIMPAFCWVPGDTFAYWRHKGHGTVGL